jgi:hypothetical protein
MAWPPTTHQDVQDAVTALQTGTEAKISRTGAAAGQVPVLQADGSTLAFGTISGGGGSSTGLDPSTFTSVTCPGGSTSFGNFVTVPCTTVVSDANSHWDNVNYQYVVPATGTYLILARVRPTDNTPSGRDLGMGVHSSNSDGAWFQWQPVAATTTGGRFTENYQRLDPFTAGDRLRLYVYWDGTSPTGITAASLQIIRVF